ncbi:MAG: Gfo/Idh/MocA family protein [Candidatus Heimdallarchaeota archaeon]
MAKMKTRLGLIGIGHMGRTHLYNARKMKNVKIVAVADALKKNRRRAEKLGVKNVYNDYSDLFEKTELDAVVISLPNVLRVDSITAAAENGVDVFVDKPLARTPEDAKTITAAVNKENTRVMVSTNFRFFPHVQKLEKQLREGIIGDIEIATIEHIMHGPFSHPLVPRPVPEWWFNKESVGGGALMDNGHHILDLFNWLFPNVEVLNSHLGFRYNLEMEDSASIMVKSKETGTLGMLNAGWFSHVLFPRLDFRIITHGTTGYLNTDELKPGSFHVYAAKVAFKNLFRRLTFRAPEYLAYTYYFRSYFASLERFITCVQTGHEFPISLESQLHVIQLIDDIYRAQNRR